MRILVKYSRMGAVRHISHLDMQRTFARAIRRAGIDAEYSQGFNPHIIMSFASPLSVGYGTEADYLEIAVKDGLDTADIMQRLNKAFTGDIDIKYVAEISKTGKKLMSLNHSASYTIVFALENALDCDKIDKTVEMILNSASYVVKDRKNREIDIVPLVIAAHVDNCRIDAVLKNSSAAALNPKVLADAVCEAAGLQASYDITRTECFAEFEGVVAPLSEICSD